MRVYTGGKAAVRQRICACEDRPHPLRPGDAVGLALSRGPERQGTGRRKRGAVAPQVELEIAREPQMRPAVARARRGERVLQKHDERLGRYRPLEKLRDVTQEPARRRLHEGAARAVVGDDTPAVEGGRDAPREYAVRRDEMRAPAVLGRLAEPQRDGERLGPRIGRLEKRKPLGGGQQRAERRSLPDPLVGHRRRPERERYEPVPGGV